MGKNDIDFGYFGKGTEGYIHYMQTFNRCFPPNEAPRGRMHIHKPSQADVYVILLALSILPCCIIGAIVLNGLCDFIWSLIF